MVDLKWIDPSQIKMKVGVVPQTSNSNWILLNPTVISFGSFMAISGMKIISWMSHRNLFSTATGHPAFLLSLVPLSNSCLSVSQLFLSSMSRQAFLFFSASCIGIQINACFVHPFVSIILYVHLHYVSIPYTLVSILSIILCVF